MINDTAVLNSYVVRPTVFKIISLLKENFKKQEKNNLDKLFFMCYSVNQCAYLSDCTFTNIIMKIDICLCLKVAPCYIGFRCYRWERHKDGWCRKVREICSDRYGKNLE